MKIIFAYPNSTQNLIINTDEKVMPDTPKDEWVSNMVKLCSNKGIDNKVLVKKFSDAYDSVVKPKRIVKETIPESIQE